MATAGAYRYADQASDLAAFVDSWGSTSSC